MSRSALLLMLAAVAALLIWFGISTFSEPTSSPAAVEAVQEPLPRPAAETTVASPAEVEARSVEPEVRQLPDAPPSAINEVIPDVPQSALATIRGTIRVSVRVNLDKQGAVVDAATVERGPSRYFERLAVEASKKWTFTPANSEQRRSMLVKFNFTRAGVTADASPLR
jgi:TonB family protein